MPADRASVARGIAREGPLAEAAHALRPGLRHVGAVRARRAWTRGPGRGITRAAMAEPKAQLAGQAENAPGRKLSGPVPIGERETTPAPPSADATPTSVPLFDPVAIAEAPLPLGAPSFASGVTSIAYRTTAEPPIDLDLRLAFVLLHVDGEATLEEIAQYAGLPGEEVQARFLELLAMGLVDLRTT